MEKSDEEGFVEESESNDGNEERDEENEDDGKAEAFEDHSEGAEQEPEVDQSMEEGQNSSADQEESEEEEEEEDSEGSDVEELGSGEDAGSEASRKYPNRFLGCGLVESDLTLSNSLSTAVECGMYDMWSIFNFWFRYSDSCEDQKGSTDSHQRDGDTTKEGSSSSRPCVGSFCTT